MTEAELRDHLTQWAKDYCNNDDFPAGMEIFVDQAVKFFMATANGLVSGAARSETFGDYSVDLDTALSIAVAEQDVPGFLKRLLVPYRRVKML